MTNTAKNMVATFNVDPSKGWRITREHTGKLLQYTVRQMTWAVVSEFGTRHHGFATEHRAKEFACSMGGRATAIEVAPYWYSEAWGRVPDAAVHAYDEAAQLDHVRPAAAVVLGSAE